MSGAAQAGSRPRGLRDDAVAFFAVFVMAGSGTALYFRVPSFLALGVVAGLTVGIGCSRWWRAALAGPFAVVCGYALAWVVADPGWGSGLLRVRDAVATAAISAVLGAVVFLVLGARERLRPLMTLAALLGIVLAMWFSGLTFSTTMTAQGFTPFSRLSSTPRLAASANDEDIYQNYVARLRAGESYYPAAVSVLRRVNAARPGSPVALTSPLSYRLPTLYVLLASLPASAGALINAMLLACSVGVIAAYLIARSFTEAVPALAGASVVAGVFAGFTGPMLLDTESWAGVAGICAVMFVVLAWRNPKRALLLHVGAAAAALVAASLRELSVAFLLLGLVASLVAADGLRRRLWAPWLAVLVATPALYAAHFSAVKAAVAGLASPNVPAFPWWHPNGSGFVSAVHLVANHGWYAAGFAWVLVVVGMAGSVIAPREPASRVMLGGVALLGPLVLLVLHPPGWATYGVPGYWGDLVMPTTLACVPLAFALLPGVRRVDGREGEPAPSDEGPAEQTGPTDAPAEPRGA